MPSSPSFLIGPFLLSEATQTDAHPQALSLSLSLGYALLGSSINIALHSALSLSLLLSLSLSPHPSFPVGQSTLPSYGSQLFVQALVHYFAVAPKAGMHPCPCLLCCSQSERIERGSGPMYHENRPTPCLMEQGSSSQLETLPP